MTISSGPTVDLSVKAERRVAREFMGRIQWEMILTGLGQCSVWLVTYVLVIQRTMPLWLGFVISTLCSCVAYLTSHEGQHGNLSGRRPRWRRLDPVVGQTSLIPLRQSHEVLRAIHLKHHAHTNDPELDPDYWTKGDHWWQPAFGANRRSGVQAFGQAINRHVERDPAFAEAMKKGVPVMKALALAQLVMVVLFPLPTLLVWWLPSHLARSYLTVFFSWEPHRPGDQMGRHSDSRFWRNLIPRYLVQSMETHVVHHLYPTIPHWDEPKALEALRPFMIERGVPGAKEIPQRVRFNPVTGPTMRVTARWTGRR